MMTLKTNPAILSRTTGYEELGTVQPLTMLSQVHWWIVSAYDQRQGTYGLLIHEISGESVAFLSSPSELDALCALIEFCIDLLAYWPACDALIEEWRSIWWLAQTMMAQQRLREVEQ